MADRNDKYAEQMALNLHILDKANNFTDWMYDEIKPFLQGNIFEVGSGQGTYSRKIINDFRDNKIILSDIDKKYVSDLKKISIGRVSVFNIDISRKEDFRQINDRIDSAFALNVLEHVDNDVGALNNVYDILSPGGRFVVLVPAHKFLYNRIDKSIGHFRRYTKSELLEKVSITKFKVKKLFYFNFLSIFGWYANGDILKRDVINEGAVGLLNKIVPALRFFEKYILRKKMGISIIVILEK